MTQPATPALYSKASNAARNAQVAEAGRAAAGKVNSDATPEQAVQAALDVAAERAAARDAGKPAPVADVSPVAQHTDKPELEAPTETTTEEPAKPDLALRLKQRQRQAQLEMEQERAKLAQDRREVEAQRAEAQKIRDNQERLSKLKGEDRAKFLAEIGWTQEDMKAYVQGELARGKPEGKALEAQTEAQRAMARVEALEKQLKDEKAQSAARDAEIRFVELSKGEDFAVINTIWADEPFTRVSEGYKAQQDFVKEFGRTASNEEILFNLELREATKLARATGDDKLMKATQESRRLFADCTSPTELPRALKPIRDAFKRPKAAAKEEKPGKKSAPGPSAQAKVSQAATETDGKPVDRRTLRERARSAGREAREKAMRGETHYNPEYLGGGKG